MTGPLTAGEPMAQSSRPHYDEADLFEDDLPPPPPPRRRGQGGAPPPRRPRFKWLRRLIGLVLGILTLGAATAGVVGWHYYEQLAGDLPTLDGLRNYQPRVMSRVYASDESLVAEFAAERRIFVPLTAIPDLVKQAFISAEDQKFWSHRGVDPTAIMRAAWMDFQQMGQGRRPVGASTITQQVAKNMLLGSNEVSLVRKAKEALLAIRIEESLPKERILELYLNEIYLGLGSYGVAAAAQTYFNKGLDELAPEEAAFLAALPKAPNNYNPFRYPDAARARRDWVLDRMAEDHAITAEQCAEAKSHPVSPSPFRHAETVLGGNWFGEDVRRMLMDKFGDDAITAGLTVQTSLEPHLQETADKALRAGLMAYDRRRGGWRGPVTHLETGMAFHSGWATSLATVKHPNGMLNDWRLAVVLEVGGNTASVGWLETPPGQSLSNAMPRTANLSLSDTQWARPAHAGWMGPVPRRMGDVLRVGDVVMVEPPEQGDRAFLRQIPTVQGALVSVEPITGRVVAMSGGWSFEASQFNRVTQALRQPGSSFKPMVYLTALEHNISPSQQFLDAPFVMDMGAQGVWRPNNYEMTFSGPTSLHVALEKSLNLVTIRVADQVTMAEVAKTAIAFHVVDQMPKVLPAALGAVDTTVMRMAGAYSSLAMGGKEVIPSLIDSIQDRDGHVIYRAPTLNCAECTKADTPPVLADPRGQVADPQSVFQLVTMMQGVVNRGTGIEAGRGLGRAIAGKTGTSQDFNDAWFAGFTPDLVTVVWVGFDQPSSLGEKMSGGVVSGPIWHEFMAEALKTRPSLQFRMPQGVSMARWDSTAGSTVDAFKPDQQPGVSIGPISAEGTDGATPGAANPGSGGLDSGMGGLY